MMRDWLIATGLFLLALTQNLGAVEQSPFHPDETRWLNRAHYLRDLTDPFGPTWRAGYLTRGQPPLGSYLMGAGLLIQGRDLETNGVWSFRHDEAWNRTAGNMASPADLAAGRRTNAVIGAFAVVVTYLAGARLTNRAGGVAGSLLLATHPLMVMLSSQALSDALLVLLLAVALLAGCRLGTRPGWGAALVLGLALGLGGATKLSPLLLSLPLAGLGLVLVAPQLLRSTKLGAKATELKTQTPIIGATCGSIFAITRRIFVPHSFLRPRPLASAGCSRVREFSLAALAPSLSGGAIEPVITDHFDRDTQLGWPLLAIPAIAAAVFVAIYPYLWSDPVGRTVGLFTFRSEEMARQGDNWAGVAVDSRGDALRRIGDRLSNEYSGLGQVTTWLQGADLALGVAGLLLLTGLALTWRRDERYLIALALLIGEASLIVLGLRSDYARYHLPLVLVMAFGVSVVVGLSWAVAAPLADRYGRLVKANCKRVDGKVGRPYLVPEGLRGAQRGLSVQRTAGAAIALGNSAQNRARPWRRRLAAAPAIPALGWWLGVAGFVLALVGAGSALGDEHLPEIVALPASPVTRATPIDAGTPVAATPGATPVAGLPLASPVFGTPAATPEAVD